ncbi:hypothetical protein BP5796_08389 [Coleophoma crateriformis]|uniref:BRCT domain-containing protein n=1 Tax=Coleophoma crateriformis TaxID=565419 RepID=A0A3D8R7G0_9HELO|nr:hypothetical protein BP5796_08389 [Coleophoma crateriformis]
MPPKKTSSASEVYILFDGDELSSVHATLASAEAASAKLSEPAIETQELVGGSVTAHPVKPAAAAKAKDEKKPKTKSAAEQRAANAEKPKARKEDESLPANVKALLAGSGDVLSGKAIVVTGVPPIMGRKNMEALVTCYGGKLAKSLSGNTSFVVIGNEAGPKKLEQIEKLGLETMNEDDFIEMLEAEEPAAKKIKL